MYLKIINNAVTCIFLIIIIGSSIMCTNKDDKDNEGIDPDTIKVTLHMYSGRPDPVFYIEKNDINSVDYLKTVMNKSKKITDVSLLEKRLYKDNSIMPSRLGYRGITIQSGSNIKDLPPVIEIYKENIKMTNNREIFNDSNRELEEFIIQKALDMGAIDKKSYDFIKNDSAD